MTCRCLAACHADNHRAEYVRVCVNATGEALLPSSANRSIPYPWRDPYSDGCWIRQAFGTAESGGSDSSTQAPSDIEVRNRQLATMLEADALSSRERGLCSGRGLYTRPMPWVPHSTKELRAASVPPTPANLMRLPRCTNAVCAIASRDGLDRSANLGLVTQTGRLSSGSASTIAPAVACAGSTGVTAHRGRGAWTAPWAHRWSPRSSILLPVGRHRGYTSTTCRPGPRAGWLRTTGGPRWISRRKCAHRQLAGGTRCFSTRWTSNCIAGCCAHDTARLTRAGLTTSSCRHTSRWASTTCSMACIG